MSDPVIKWDEAQVAALARQDYLRRALASQGGWITRTARGFAPKDTGAGAASIRTETVLEDGEWTARVSWDRAHWYMKFTDLGTKFIPAQHFLERALDRYAR